MKRLSECYKSCRQNNIRNYYEYTCLHYLSFTTCAFISGMIKCRDKKQTRNNPLVQMGYPIENPIIRHCGKYAIGSMYHWLRGYCGWMKKLL